MKRMTDTNIYDKAWFMSLEPRLKCLVGYLWAKCDNAGVWSPNWVLASAMIGAKVSVGDIAKIDNGNRHEILEDGKIWIKDFVSFQCGEELKENSPPHKKIIGLLKSYGLYDRVCVRVLSTPKEEEGEKEDDKEEEKEEETGAREKGYEADSVASCGLPVAGSALDEDVTNVLEHFNQTTGRHFPLNHFESRSVITTRLNEGYSVLDLKLIIELKTWEAEGAKDKAKQRKFLQPKVLFGKQFISNLNDVRDAKKGYGVAGESKLERQKREAAGIDI